MIDLSDDNEYFIYAALIFANSSFFAGTASTNLVYESTSMKTEGIDYTNDSTFESEEHINDN